MAAPPPASNPDRRPLPDGWITRYDENYRAWYYVDTRAQPPRSSWEHPHGPLPPPTTPPGNYQPPPNPAPSRYPVGSQQSYNQPQGQSYPQSFNQNQPYPVGGYPSGQPQQDNRAYGFPSQQNYGGPPPGNYGTPGGWQQQQQPAWQQTQQQGYSAQPQVQSAPPPARGRHGLGGMGPGLLAGAGGLAAGALLMEGFEHHERHERREEEEREEQAYDQGYIDSQENQEYGGVDNW